MFVIIMKQHHGEITHMTLMTQEVYLILFYLTWVYESLYYQGGPKRRLVFYKAQTSKIQKLFQKQNLLDTLWVQLEWGLGNGEPSSSKTVELILRTVQLDLNWVELVFRIVQLDLNWVDLVFRIVQLDLNWETLWSKPVEPALGLVLLVFLFEPVELAIGTGSTGVRVRRQFRFWLTDCLSGWHARWLNRH
jgi:hypothetical protein